MGKLSSEYCKLVNADLNHIPLLNEQVCIFFYIYRYSMKSFVFEKNDFDEVSKNLATNLKIILLDYQNNYLGCINNYLRPYKACSRDDVLRMMFC